MDDDAGAGGETVASEHEHAFLADGAAVEIRPIRADDVVGLVEFHEGLSMGTVFRRFFGVHPHLAQAEAEHFCTVDSVDRFALVALVDQTIVGVARMERLEAVTTAEVAFVVADRFQHRGLGCLLAQRLASAAQQRGVQRLIAATLADNWPMRRLLPAAGFHVTASMGDGLVWLTCPTDCRSPRRHRHLHRHSRRARRLGRRTALAPG